VILVDANLLLCAKHSGFAQHDLAREWLDGRLSAPGRVGLPWPSLLAFVRLSSNHRIFEHPMTVAAAWRQVRQWLALRSAWVPLPTDQHAEVLGELLGRGGLGPKLVMDAHLAALAIEHGLVLCTADADFGRFAGLRWEDPLRGGGSA